MKDIKIGFIGLGNRGMYLLKDVVAEQGENVVAVCDCNSELAQKGAEEVLKKLGKRPCVCTDYKEIINNPEVNTVIVASGWDSHLEIVLSAMNAKKAVATEVSGAYTIEECWKLVDTYERTKTPFMFLENCCFGRRELMVLNMVRLGVLGEIVHCAGGYRHDLREGLAKGVCNGSYRIKNYLTRNCDNYPTHELGPISKILNINHGNRMLSLCSIASKASGLKEYAKEHTEDCGKLLDYTVVQGDIVTTVIRCSNGETITLNLDTTLPRFYSRDFSVRGTKGMYDEATDSLFFGTKEEEEHTYEWRKYAGGNAEEYQKKYDHPLWKEYEKQGIKGAHDGMDWLEFTEFFKALKEDKPMPVDVYEAALWMAITPLSEESILKGGAPVSIPDFTRGKYNLNIID